MMDKTVTVALILLIMSFGAVCWKRLTSHVGMTYIDGFLVKDQPGKDAVVRRLKNLQDNIVTLLEYEIGRAHV